MPFSERRSRAAIAAIAESTRALRDQGWEVNHKRVARLMREDGLLAIRKRRFIPQTTDSGHDFEVALTALRNAIESRQPTPGLIRHSDVRTCRQ